MVVFGGAMVPGAAPATNCATPLVDAANTF